MEGDIQEENDVVQKKQRWFNKLSKKQKILIGVFFVTTFLVIAIISLLIINSSRPQPSDSDKTVPTSFAFYDADTGMLEPTSYSFEQYIGYPASYSYSTEQSTSYTVEEVGVQIYHLNPDIRHIKAVAKAGETVNRSIRINPRGPNSIELERFFYCELTVSEKSNPSNVLISKNIPEFPNWSSTAAGIDLEVGNFDIRVSCTDNKGGKYSDKITASVIEPDPESCFNKDTKFSAVDVDQPQVSNSMVGSWEGCVWFGDLEPIRVSFEFSNDGKYTAKTLGKDISAINNILHPALYYNSNKPDGKYEMLTENFGLIYIDEREGLIRDLKFSGDMNKLVFNLEFYKPWQQLYYLERIN